MLLVCAALSGALAVMLGAFGAHALKPLLSTDLLAVYQTGVQYHFYHTLALLATGALARLSPTNPWFRRAGIAFLAGILLFSGSLYLLAVTGQHWLGPITPIGGLLLLGGWLALGLGTWQSHRAQRDGME